MNRFPVLIAIAVAVSAMPLLAQSSGAPKPKRINRAIELLESGQPSTIPAAAAVMRKARRWPPRKPTTSTTRWSTARST
jgi:hypothetical protein